MRCRRRAIVSASRRNGGGGGRRRAQRRARLAAEGHSALRSVTLTGGAWLEVDALLVSGGFSPNAQLYSQAKGPLAWDERLITFVPDGAVEGFSVVGAANGVFSLDAALADARAAVAALQRRRRGRKTNGARKYAGDRARLAKTQLQGPRLDRPSCRRDAQGSRRRGARILPLD